MPPGATFYHLGLKAVDKGSDLLGLQRTFLGGTAYASQRPHCNQALGRRAANLANPLMLAWSPSPCPSPHHHYFLKSTLK